MLFRSQFTKNKHIFFIVFISLLCFIKFGNASEDLNNRDEIGTNIESDITLNTPSLKEFNHLQSTVNSIKQDINNIKFDKKNSNYNRYDESIDRKDLITQPGVKVVHIHRDKAERESIESGSKVKKGCSNIAHISRGLARDSKDISEYVVSGSFARCVLLTGVVAETNADLDNSQQPILLRLVDAGIFSKGYKTKQIKEAVIIGECYGNISSERAICRLLTLSMIKTDGSVIERPVDGWIVGEDGRPGVKGVIVDKSSNVARMAILNGILSGIAGFFQNQAVAKDIIALNDLDSIKAGASSGVGNALQKLADYAIKRSEQMSPVIVIGAGRTVDIVFKKGFPLKDVTSIYDNDKSSVPQISLHNKQDLSGDESKEVYD